MLCVNFIVCILKEKGGGTVAIQVYPFEIYRHSRPHYYFSVICNTNDL